MLFGVHGYPNDYFRFIPGGFRSLLAGFDDVWVTGVGDPDPDPDPDIPFQVLGVGAKGRRLDRRWSGSRAGAQAAWEAAEREVRIGALRFPPRQLARTFGAEAARLHS